MARDGGQGNRFLDLLRGGAVCLGHFGVEVDAVAARNLGRHCQADELLHLRFQCGVLGNLHVLERVPGARQPGFRELAEETRHDAKRGFDVPVGLVDGVAAGGLRDGAAAGDGEGGGGKDGSTGSHGMLLGWVLC